MNALDAIPVKVPSQIQLKNFLRERCSSDPAMFEGLRLGVFLCHFGELLRRREGDPEISNIGITDELFEEKMAYLLQNTSTDVVEYIHSF